MRGGKLATSLSTRWKRVDTILEQAQGAALALSPLEGQACALLAKAVREQGRLSPYVRSLMLVRHDRVYCSSLRGSVDLPARHFTSAADSAGRAVMLVASSASAHDVPSLLYYQAGPARDSGVLVAVEGRYLLDLLLLPESRDIAAIELRVGNDALHSGNADLGAPMNPSEQLAVSLPSATFPLAVTVAASEGLVAFYRNVFIWSYLPLALFAGLIAAYVVWWATGRRFSAEGDIAHALRNNEFRVHYQPIVDAATGLPYGAEALLRWAHPARGMVGPDMFIALAEECGQIVPLTRHLFQLIKHDFAGLAYPDNFHLGVNLAPEHFRDSKLVDDVRDLLGGLGRRSLRLVTEITERNLLDDSAATLAVMNELRALGVTLAIDDFGTGHSSLAYLQKYEMDYLKIDKGFVATIGTDAINAAVLDTIIQLGHRLSLILIAEGVENERQADFLSAQGVQYLQGYRFARPMPVAELEKWLRRHATRPVRGSSSAPF